MNTHEHLVAGVEAILFSSGNPIEFEKIAKTLDLTTENVKILVKDIQDKLDEAQSGLTVLILSDKCQMVARANFAYAVRDVLDIERNTPLSGAAFEVLAVVAYNEPVTRAFIEQVRGVDCTGVVSTLLQRGLIEERGRLDLPGRPLIYGTTPHFLRSFSLESLDELPSLPEKEKEQAEEYGQESKGDVLKQKNSNETLEYDETDTAEINDETIASNEIGEN